MTQEQISFFDACVSQLAPDALTLPEMKAAYTRQLGRTPMVGSKEGAGGPGVEGHDGDAELWDILLRLYGVKGLSWRAKWTAVRVALGLSQDPSASDDDLDSDHLDDLDLSIDSNVTETPHAPRPPDVGKLSLGQNGSEGTSRMLLQRGRDSGSESTSAGTAHPAPHSPKPRFTLSNRHSDGSAGNYFATDTVAKSSSSRQARPATRLPASAGERGQGVMFAPNAVTASSSVPTRFVLPSKRESLVTRQSLSLPRDEALSESDLSESESTSDQTVLEDQMSSALEGSEDELPEDGLLDRSKPQESAAPAHATSFSRVRFAPTTPRLLSSPPRPSAQDQHPQSEGYIAPVANPPLSPSPSAARSTTRPQSAFASTPTFNSSGWRARLRQRELEHEGAVLSPLPTPVPALSTTTHAASTSTQVPSSPAIYQPGEVTQSSPERRNRHNFLPTNRRSAAASYAPPSPTQTPATTLEAASLPSKTESTPASNSPRLHASILSAPSGQAGRHFTEVISASRALRQKHEAQEQARSQAAQEAAFRRHLNQAVQLDYDRLTTLALGLWKARFLRVRQRQSSVAEQEKKRLTRRGWERYKSRYNTVQQLEQVAVERDAQRPMLRAWKFWANLYHSQRQRAEEKRTRLLLEAYTVVHTNHTANLVRKKFGDWRLAHLAFRAQSFRDAHLLTGAFAMWRLGLVQHETFRTRFDQFVGRSKERLARNTFHLWVTLVVLRPVEKDVAVQRDGTLLYETFNTWRKILYVLDLLLF